MKNKKYWYIGMALSMFCVAALPVHAEQVSESITQEVTLPAASIVPTVEQSVVATYSTYYDEAESRAINIRQASTYINQLQLQPGESFSFSKAVQRRTSENGYVVAPSYAGGSVVTSVGGGICQVSSTLYHALLQCGIIPTERYNHSGTVYYAEMGLDAAIAQGSKDFKFVNTLPNPITISMRAENGVLTVDIISNTGTLQGYTYLPVSQRVGEKEANAYLVAYQGQTLANIQFIGTSKYISVFY